ncbi:Uncharacterised protein [Mycobacteroides abscessus subsp. abscessus]|nr:Uncharacterised protein [Mycobacteroides abscessus subsp. abscessus]
MTSSSTNWIESRSPVTMRMRKPSALAWVVSVAITSSASKPSIAMTGMPSAPSTSLVSSTCPRNSSGVWLRLALYSG